jgi:hypothetical protein
LDVTTLVSIWASVVAIAIGRRVWIVAVEFGGGYRVFLIGVIIIDLPCTAGH